MHNCCVRVALLHGQTGPRAVGSPGNLVEEVDPGDRG